MEIIRLIDINRLQNKHKEEKDYNLPVLERGRRDFLR